MLCYICSLSVISSEVSDDIVLHTVELLLRLSSLSAAVKTTSDQLLLVSVPVNLVLTVVFLCQLPRVGPGHPSSPLVYLLPHLFPFLLFLFFPWLYLFSSFVHPFPFYQNRPTPFPGRRS